MKYKGEMAYSFKKAALKKASFFFGLLFFFIGGERRGERRGEHLPGEWSDEHWPAGLVAGRLVGILDADARRAPSPGVAQSAPRRYSARHCAPLRQRSA